MHISIIDDEKILTNKISKKLQLNGYWVSEYYSYNDFFKKWNTFISDLYIIDISLWDGNWFDIIKYLKYTKKINSNIIIISWFWDTDKKIFWLDLWADDYITKPFLPDELLARVRAIFRRNDNMKILKNETIKYKDISYNKKNKEIFMFWNEVLLTKKEFLIFDLFINNIWEVIDKNYLITYVWWTQSIDVNDNTLSVAISRLRKKFCNTFNIQSRKNFWYILD